MAKTKRHETVLALQYFILIFGHAGAEDRARGRTRKLKEHIPLVEIFIKYILVRALMRAEVLPALLRTRFLIY
jgi:hypothetical protein